MNLEKFNSKRYAAAVFMSICLLTSSFLSMDARAFSFETLKTKAIEWRKDGKVFNVHEAAKILDLRVKETIITQIPKTKKDKKSTSSSVFTPLDLESKDNTDRNLARIHNATLEIFRKLIEEPNIELNMENHITNNDFLQFKKHSSSILHNNKHTASKYYSSKVEQKELLEKASQVLGMNFNIKDLKNDDPQIRHKAKDNLVILEEYIKMIQNSIPNNNQKTSDKTGIFQNLAKS